MPYEKTVWSERIVERPLTFVMQENQDGTITLIPSEGTVVQSGTPITADNLNKLEDAIAGYETVADTKLDKAGGTLTGPLEGTTINATVEVQEGGVNLATKYQAKGNYQPAGSYQPAGDYLLKTGGTLTGALVGTVVNATTNLQENGTNLSAKYQPVGSYAPTGQYVTWSADPNGVYLNVGTGANGKAYKVFLTSAQPGAGGTGERRVWIQTDA